MIRKMIAKILGKNVALRDFDGQVTFARAYRLGGRMYADRYGLGECTVELADDGTVVGHELSRMFVKSWSPA